MANRNRSGREIIDQAIRENRVGVWLLYLFAVSFVGVGLTVIVMAFIKNQFGMGIVGFASTTLFWPAMNSARRTRKENIAIRLLEAPLDRADTAKEAADMLNKLFNEILGDKKKDG